MWTFKIDGLEMLIRLVHAHVSRILNNAHYSKFVTHVPFCRLVFVMTTVYMNRWCLEIKRAGSYYFQRISIQRLKSFPTKSTNEVRLNDLKIQIFIGVLDSVAVKKYESSSQLCT